MANEPHKVAETFVGVPDGRDTAHALRLLRHFLDRLLDSDMAVLAPWVRDE